MDTAHKWNIQLAEKNMGYRCPKHLCRGGSCYDSLIMTEKAGKRRKMVPITFFSGIWGNRRDSMYVVGINPAGLYDHVTHYISRKTT